MVTVRSIDFFRISFDTQGYTTVSVSVYVAVVALLLVTLCLWLKHRRSLSSWNVVEAEIPWAGGKIKIRPDYQDIQIAHKAWVELATRKAGLPFDAEHDVIIEVYDSWYALFSVLRDLAKQIPADRVRKSKDTENLVILLVEALNQGLRPHLTRWQAKFRRWYELEAQNHPNLTPQEIQKNYPSYDELVADLRMVNSELRNYTKFIREIAHGS